MRLPGASGARQVLAMQLAPSIFAFAGLWAAQVALPGPNFVRVSSAAFSGSARLATVTSFGTATGNSLWCLVAAIGAAAVTRNPTLAVMLRLLGASYFAWYAIRLFVRAFTNDELAQISTGALAHGRAYLDGAATALANPQTAIFFATALSSTFTSLSLPIVLAAVVTVAAVNCLWYAIVIAILSAPAARAAYLRLRPALECFFALLLTLAAAKLVSTVM
jgi:threonine/homoserine/homoserine lactone efflux protein